MVLKKKIKKYNKLYIYFYGLNIGSPGARQSCLHLNKLGRGTLGNATYQCYCGLANMTIHGTVKRKRGGKTILKGGLDYALPAQLG